MMIPRILALLLLLGLLAAPLLYRVEQDRRFRNLRTVEAGELYRSGQLTREGFARVLREHRIGTVISMRETKSGEEYEDGFEETICEDLGVRFERFNYLDWSAPDGSQPARANVARFLGLMNDPNVPKPVLVHCFAGIHRTGVHVAAYRIEKQGWSPAEAIDEMRSMGTPRTTFSKDLIRFVETMKPGAQVGNEPLER